jgi:hypothetical protein
VCLKKLGSAKVARTGHLDQFPSFKSRAISFLEHISSCRSGSGGYRNNQEQEKKCESENAKAAENFVKTDTVPQGLLDRAVMCRECKKIVSHTAQQSQDAETKGNRHED